MKITSVRLFPIDKEESRLKAIASIIFDEVFIVRDIRVISGDEGLFVAMPSVKLSDNRFKDVCHPINTEFQDYISEAIIEEYSKGFETEE